VNQSKTTLWQFLKKIRKRWKILLYFGVFMGSSKDLMSLMFLSTMAQGSDVDLACNNTMMLMLFYLMSLDEDHHDGCRRDHCHCRCCEGGGHHHHEHSHGRDRRNDCCF